VSDPLDTPREVGSMLIPRQLLFLFAPLTLLLLPFLILPAALGLLSTFTDYALVRPEFHFVGFSNDAAVLSDAQLRRAFGNVLVLVLVSVPAELLIGFTIAYVHTAAESTLMMESVLGTDS
jgi:multiple sugar transport system permease protein